MIDAIKRGDEFAFEQAYIAHRSRVYGYFLKKAKNPEDARDLLQVTFLKLWQYRRSLSTEYLLEQHIFHIARTVFVDHLRKQNRRSKMREAVERGINPSSQYAYISTEFDLRSRLGSALSTMPELRKKIFELNRIEGFSYQEIARLLSISVKTVDNNLTKALRYLRKAMLFVAFFLTCLKFF
jgi:RNA polymerase sigma-70 factor (ECF subfamily)